MCYILCTTYTDSWLEESNQCSEMKNIFFYFHAHLKCFQVSLVQILPLSNVEWLLLKTVKTNNDSSLFNLVIMGV
jgi:hypothetical protein